jgi:uncharacterized protein YbbK (DUF523 family)
MASACLLGLRCRFDGKSEGAHPGIPKDSHVIPFCPEQLGGLNTPREPADFENEKFTGDAVLTGGGKVLTRSGTDVTAAFVRGAEESAALAIRFGVETAFLRRRSPSCGYGETYSRGKVVPGNGVTAAKLRAMGVEIIPLGGENKG